MKILITLLSLLFVNTANSYALLDSMQVRGQGNVYYLGFIKVYKASLLTRDEIDTLNILDSKTSKCLKLDYNVSLTSENFIEGANTVLARQHSVERLNTLKNEIETLHNAYQPVQEGDYYLLCYNGENSTTTLTLNGNDLVSITSEPFSSLYFGIWLSPDLPIDKKLQSDLLAGKN